jgi:large subunit ribosomal protein L24
VQSTLLALAIAIILALVSAIVAPLVVDWNHYRAAIETEASRLTGLNVRINGAIEARLLPSPVVTVHDVDAGVAGHKPQLRAGMLKLDLALGPLLSGKVQAAQVRLIAPQFTLELDRSGAVDVLGMPLRPTISISHLDVEDGRVTLTDAASGARLVVQKLSFSGEIGAFGGSFSGEGNAVIGDTLYGYRIAGAPDDKGGIKIRFGVDPANRPLTTAFDGTLTFARGVPHFAGTLALARPVGATLANGQRVVSVPWHATGAIKATPAAAAITQIAFRYGPEERALNITGSADLTFGAHPSLAGKMAALQLDLDQALAAPDLTNRPPLVAIRSFLQAFVDAATLPMPAQVGVDIDALTVGGTTLETLRGGLDYDGFKWRVDGLRFRAPGMTDMTVSGALTGVARGFSFDGHARLASADAGALLAYVDGRGGRSVSKQPKTLTAQGDVTIASDRMAVDRLSATLDQESITGRLAYDWPQTNRPARLDAVLRADDLNLDSLRSFATRALGQRGFVLPQEATIVLDIGRAHFAGIDARAVNARVKVAAGQWRIDTLSIGDLGGAKVALSGRIDALSSRPSGQLTLDLDAGALDGLSAIAAKFAPEQVNAMHRLTGQLAPAALHAVLDVRPAATSDSTVTLHVVGNLATMQIAVDATAGGELAHAGAADLKLNGRLDADDGTVLVRLFGLDGGVAVDQLPGRLVFSASGPLNGDLRVDGRFTAGGLGADAEGRVHLAGAAAPVTGTLLFSVAAADLRPLQQAMTGQAGTAIPVSARGALAIDGAKLSLTNLVATVGTHALQGHATIGLTRPLGVEGAITADKADAAGVMALLLGWPRASPAGASWSRETIGAGAFGPIKGAVSFTVGSAALTPPLTATSLKGVVHFDPATLAFDNIDGRLAGGHLTGGLSFHRNADGLAARLGLNLAGAAAAAIVGPAFDVSGGRLTAAVQSDGFGASPISLIGSLHGSATMALANAQFSGLDLEAFDAAIGAAGAGAPDLAKVRTAVNAVLTKGHVEVPQGNVAVAITSGAASIKDGNLTTKGGGELALDGALDLGNGTIGARMTLSKPPPDALVASRPGLAVTVEGSLTAPRRSLDLSTLTAWLTLRRAELQTRLIESIEAEQREAVTGPQSPVSSPGAHLVEPGTAIELPTPPNLLPAPGSQARAIERLQPTAPAAMPAAPAQNRAGAAANDPAPAAGAQGSLDVRPDMPRAPVRSDDGTASAGATAPTKRRPAPGLIGVQP